mmetsp:Transcript_55926/g.76310  ORF Transcript_55926/g.76310 Transcript_55926/m.76310 type:complete len:229 (-) Transcript_55926:97-783(-)
MLGSRLHHPHRKRSFRLSQLRRSLLRHPLRKRSLQRRGLLCHRLRHPLLQLRLTHSKLSLALLQRFGHARVDQLVGGDSRQATTAAITAVFQNGIHLGDSTATTNAAQQAGPNTTRSTGNRPNGCTNTRSNNTRFHARTSTADDTRHHARLHRHLTLRCLRCNFRLKLCPVGLQLSLRFGIQLCTLFQPCYPLPVALLQRSLALRCQHSLFLQSSDFHACTGTAVDTR